MIVGKTRQSAMDAAELVDVSYEVDKQVALKLDELQGPLVWPKTPDNIASLHHSIELLWKQHWICLTKFISTLIYQELRHVLWRCVALWEL